MVLRRPDEPEEVFILEASPDNGVWISKWSNFRLLVLGEECFPGTEITKIALRKLTWERPDSSKDIIEQFISETIGARFKDADVEEMASPVLMSKLSVVP